MSKNRTQYLGTEEEIVTDEQKHFEEVLNMAIHTPVRHALDRINRL